MDRLYSYRGRYADPGTLKLIVTKYPANLRTVAAFSSVHRISLLSSEPPREDCASCGMCWWKQTIMDGCEHAFFAGDGPVRFCDDTTASGRPCGTKVGHPLLTVRVVGAVCGRCAVISGEKQQRRITEAYDTVDRKIAQIKDGLRSARRHLEGTCRARSEARLTDGQEAACAVGDSGECSSSARSNPCGSPTETAAECDRENEAWDWDDDGQAPLNYLCERGWLSSGTQSV